MRLKVLQDHGTAHPFDTGTLRFTEGQEIEVENRLAEFLLKDGRGRAFEVIDDPAPVPSPDEADETSRHEQLMKQTKSELLDEIGRRWVGLPGVNAKTKHDDIVKAIEEREAEEAAAAEPDVVDVNAAAAAAGDDLLIGFDDGDPVYVATVVSEDGEVSIAPGERTA